MAPEYIIHKLVRHAQNPFCISWEYFISPKHEKQVFLADSELFSQRFWEFDENLMWWGEHKTIIIRDAVIQWGPY